MDASSASDGSPGDVSDEPPQLLGDGAADVFVAWCEAGPPFAMDSSTPCDIDMNVPCGLPAGTIVAEGGVLSQTDCEKMCPLDAGSLQGCREQLRDASDAAQVTLVECDMCGTGRRPPGLHRAVAARALDEVGDWLARAAYVEAAAAVAFHGLSRELRALDAPHSLVRAAERAIHDEVRHARSMHTLARHRGARPLIPRASPFRFRSLEELALDNAVEGCVRETYGALVAGWAATHAHDRDIARAMAVIHDDETRHAALSLTIDGWATRQLGRAGRRRVARARRAGVAALRDALRVEPAPPVVRAVGLPTAAESAVLLQALLRFKP